MRVYISGKIGEEVLSEATRQKFAQAEELLQARGFETFNPTTSGLGVLAEAMTKIRLSLQQIIMSKNIKKRRMRSWYECILALDIEELTFCDAIYMIGNFMESPGAMAEYAFAVATGKHFFFSEERAARWHICRLYNKTPDGSDWYEWLDKRINEICIPFSVTEYRTEYEEE